MQRPNLLSHVTQTVQLAPWERALLITKLKELASIGPRNGVGGCWHLLGIFDPDHYNANGPRS